MNRDDIIRMARESGASRVLDAMVFDRDEMLERFAALVAAAEREECARVCDEVGADLRINSEAQLEVFECAREIRARGEV